MQKVIWKGPADKKEIALTFDDGPKPEYSQKVLDILTRYTVKATFFVVGKEAKDFPDIIMRMNDEGHEIGNHTYTHRNISVMPEEALKKELTKTNTVIFDITGKYPGLFRPPGGDFVFRTRSVASKCGLRQVNWSVNAGDFVKMTRDFDLDEDYEKTGRKLADSVIAKAGNGDIILFHNGSEETIRALPLIIESLRAKGYEFVTVSKMMSKGKS
ncbi:MAG: polysaccharide deacetylase family protein [Candidatus Saganbacteria bacterium]|nr:polysaccharide deacetylase family protein [Candidatus Saganbacteria bacterium]